MEAFICEKEGGNRMSWIDCFRRDKKSASVARDRLSIVIAQQRSKLNQPDYLPLMRQEILAVVAKHIDVDLNAVQVDLQVKDNNSVLELNVTLPEREEVIA